MATWLPPKLTPAQVAKAKGLLAQMEADRYSFSTPLLAPGPTNEDRTLSAFEQTAQPGDTLYLSDTGTAKDPDIVGAYEMPWVGRTWRQKMGVPEFHPADAVPVVGGLMQAVDVVDAALRDDPNYGVEKATLPLSFLAPAGKLGLLGGKALSGLMLPAMVKAYHGSRHARAPEEWAPGRAFKDENILSGEGGNAFGWGHYLAEHKDTGKTYMTAGPPGDDLVVRVPGGAVIRGEAIDDVGLTATKYLGIGRQAAGQFPHNTAHWAKQRAAADGEGDAVLARIDEWADAKIGYEKNPGNLYRVEGDFDEVDLLDWDKPLSEQPEKVRAALDPFVAKVRAADRQQLLAEPAATSSGGAAWSDDLDAIYRELGPVSGPVSGARLTAREEAAVEDLLELKWGEDKKGQGLYKELVGLHGSKEAASRALNEAGIPGIRYDDAMSRGEKYSVKLSTSKGPYADTAFSTKELAAAYAKEKEAEGFITETVDEGTSNYVIFDRKLLKIVGEGEDAAFKGGQVDKGLLQPYAPEVLQRAADGRPMRRVPMNPAAGDNILAAAEAKVDQGLLGGAPASMVPTPTRPLMTEPAAGSTKSAADEFASRVRAMGPEYEAVIDVDRGGSVYVRVLQYPLKKDGTRAKGRSGQPVKFKARFSDHGSYWGNNISVDPVSGNTVDDVENVLRYHLTGEGDAPVVGVSSIDPTDGSQLVGTSAYNRDYARNGVNPLSYDPQKMTPSPMALAAEAKLDTGLLGGTPDTGLLGGRKAADARATEMGFDLDAPQYHQTTTKAAKAIGKEGFDPSIVAGRAWDEIMPDGVFLKPTDETLPLINPGQKQTQMPLVTRAQNVVEFENREELTDFLYSHESWAALADKQDGLMDVAPSIMEGIAADETGERAISILTELGGMPKADAVALRENGGPAALSSAVEGLLNHMRAAGAADMRAEATEIFRINGVGGVKVIEDWGGDIGEEAMTTTTVVLDPSHIRSPKAKFDPSKIDSRNIMAGLAGAGVATGLMLPGEDRNGGI